MTHQRSTYAAVLLYALSVGIAPAAAQPVASPNSRVPYLGVDGTFTVDPAELAANDPRNPKRIDFTRMVEFSFFADFQGEMPIAWRCRYAYRGALGDPYYYPERSKTSIWDLFELVDGEAECNRFTYVILRAPHGNPVHMHMRYGDPSANFEKLLSMSNGPEEKTKLDPWWSVYCANGVSSCDR